MSGAVVYEVALATSGTIAVAYLAIALTIVRKVLLYGDQWRTNPLATATAAIFFSCSVGHGLHALHLVELGRAAPELYDSHMAVWDVVTACVALFYWSIRGRLEALRDTGVLFQDDRVAAQQRLAGLLDQLFDGVVVLDRDLDAGPPTAVSLREQPGLAALFAGLGPVAAEQSAVLLADLCALTGSAPQRADLAGDTGRTYGVDLLVWGESSVVLTWQDTTSASVLERDKRATEARLAAAFDASPVAMALVGEAGVVLANAAVGDLIGRRPHGLWESLFDAHDELEAGRRLVAALEGHPSTPWDARVSSVADDTRWVTVSLAPVREADGVVHHVVAHLVDIEDRKRYESRLRHVAEHDPLTGLANRRRFEHELLRHCDVVTRYGGRGALLMLDLDHFKEVNDTLGHATGDQLLVSVAQLLQAETRESDVVARLGGDEFAVLLPAADREESEAMARRLCAVVRQHSRSLREQDATQRVTVSIGVAAFGDVPATPEGMLMAADLTLYDAKESGRDTWALYRDGSHHQPRTKSRLEWLDRLRTAVEQSTLVVTEQPILDLRSGVADRAELLLRLPDGAGGLVEPSRFLYMAESSNLICDIDAWMMAFALELLARRPQTGLAVNLSGRSLSDRVVTGELEAMVRAAGLAPGRLVVEVTETAAVANLHEARESLQGFQDAGCLVALDDFGAGFGSLAYVKHLPFDLLKIDGQFVEGCLDNAVDMTVVDAVVSLAHGLGKQVVAEHVGDLRTVQALARRGVDYGQGYVLGRPEVVAPVVPAPRRVGRDLGLARP